VSAMVIWGLKLLSEVKNLTDGDYETEWVTDIRYLGVNFTSAKMLTVDMSMQIRKFYAASNSVLHNSTYVSEMSRVHLIEAYALSLLTYACEAFNMPAAQDHGVSVCWNNVYRRLLKCISGNR